MAPETWRALLAATAAFAKIEPWTWMHDCQLLGVRHPKTGATLLCSILGRLREVFGLLAFRNPDGHRWVLGAILGTEAPEAATDPDRGMAQDCLKVGFTRKAELAEQDRKVLSAAGFIPAVQRGSVWPSFRSLVPGCYPWHLTPAEAETLLYVLPRVTAFAALYRERPDVHRELAEGGVPFVPADFDPAQRSLQPEDLDWTLMIPPPEPPVDLVTLGEATAAQLRALPQASGFDLEVDVCYSLAVVGEGERPYFPRMALAVDRASGLIAAMHLAHRGPNDEPTALAKAIEQALCHLRHRPQSFHVRHRRIADMLAPAAAQLGVAVRHQPVLMSLDAARDELNARFG